MVEIKIKIKKRLTRKCETDCDCLARGISRERGAKLLRVCVCLARKVAVARGYSKLEVFCVLNSNYAFYEFYYFYIYTQVLALFQVAVARGYSKLEARSVGKRKFESPAFGFVLMKEGRKETESGVEVGADVVIICLLYTSPSPRDLSTSRMPSSA